jgi:Adenylate and Guanylate cyclase catalytic domain
MCVCGLPEPTAEHSERMADFALGMVEAMRKVCAENGNVELSMRVGLHSGTCVAGVLMGERARFQLFGDTINTASRMESTGVAGRVQVSETTAQLLRDSAQFELEYRGKVNAKGKGTLDTYWLLRRVAGEPYQAPSKKSLSPQSSNASSFMSSFLGRRTSSGGSDDGKWRTQSGHGHVVVEPTLPAAAEEGSEGVAVPAAV